MPTADRMLESVNTINCLVGMGLVDQAGTLLRSPVKAWGRSTELIRAEELIGEMRDRAAVVKDTGRKHRPVCGSLFAEFSPLPEEFIRNMIRYRYRYMARSEMTSFAEYLCQVCGASDRERLYSIWLEHEASSGRLNGIGKCIHFAPEAALSRRIIAMNCFGEYKTAYMSMPGVDYHVDIAALPFEDESFGLRETSILYVVEKW